MNTHVKHKKAYNIDLKKVAREQGLVNSNTMKDHEDEHFEHVENDPSLNEFHEEASITLEDTNSKEVDNDGFDFINVEDEM